MKSVIKHFAVIVLFLFCTMAIPSCQNDDEEYDGLVVTASSTISDVGGVLQALDDNVVLVFPVGALSEPVTFSVNTCFNTLQCDFVLKPIIIEPVISFDQPVLVILRYDGSLATGTAINGNMCLKACLFNSELDFYTNKMASSCICEIDNESKNIIFCICQSGIFTLSVDN